MVLLPTDARLPVFYCIYGGGFNQGGTSLPLCNGAEMTRQGVIFVGVNYRVGSVVLMAHPELTTEAGTSGNHAIEDMIAGLRWVRDNIENFGSDPAIPTAKVCRRGPRSTTNRTRSWSWATRSQLARR